MVQPNLVHRCILCRFRWDLCVCEAAPRLNVRTRVVVLMHAKEWRRSSNTGHLARLALQGAAVVQHGREGHPRLDMAALVPPGCAPLLLYPGAGAAPLTPEYVAGLPEAPAALIVPDGSWGQASQMLRRIPGLEAVPRVCLARLAAPVERMRRNLSPDRMSTFEAVAQALGALEGPAVEAELDAFFRRINARMLHLRGRLSHDAVVAADAAAAVRAASPG